MAKPAILPSIHRKRSVEPVRQQGDDEFFDRFARVTQIVGLSSVASICGNLRNPWMNPSVFAFFGSGTQTASLVT